MMIHLIPKIFYADVAVGIDLFVRSLGFEVLYQDDSLTVVAREGAKAYLVQDSEFAARDRPELSIETDTIDAIYSEVAERSPEILHPNGKFVAIKPWGAKEFAVRDSTDVCVIFRQW